MRVGSEVEKKDTIRKKAHEYHQRGTPFLSFRWKRSASRAVTRLRRIGIHMAAGLPYLIKQRQVFVIDLPGHGRSKLTQPWCLREVAPLLASWLRQMALPPTALVGHSMGGAIALHLAAHAPELVERLVLVDAAGIPFQASLPVLATRSVRSMLQPGEGGYPWPLVSDILRRPRLRLLYQAAQQLTSSDFRAEMATITIPTLILWGERDPILPLEMGKALSMALPHATFLTLPNCGHRPALSQPELFSRLVLQFLC